MTSTFDLVTQLNAAARTAGRAEAIAQFDNITTQAQYRVPYELTVQAISAGDHVLDWGCGNGHFSLLLEHLGARITGFSFEPPPASMMKSANFTFVPGSETEPRTLPFADATFDAAVSVGVLEHVWETGGDEPGSLRELARVLTPGGTLLTFHFPNRDGWVERVVKLLRLKKHFHHRKYGEADIRTLWGDAGFVINHIGRYNALPRAELRHLPAKVKNARWFSRTYSLLDDAVAAVAPRICTYYYVVATRS